MKFLSKTLISIITIIFMAGGLSSMAKEKKDIYQIKTKLINGQEVSLEAYQGKALLIVNTASKCGFTGQYAGLQKLYETYKDRGFNVLAFPSNDFMGQEPGTNEEIRKFCDLRFKVTFPLFEKISVKGKNIHPLYRYLTEESSQKGAISWNFNKFLVSPSGEVAARFGSKTSPEDPELVKAVETLLPG